MTSGRRTKTITRKCCAAGLVVLGLGSGTMVAGQEVAPKGLQTVEGSSSNPFLFGRSNSVRIMNVFNQSELPASFATPRAIRELVLRADTRNNTTLYAKKRNILLAIDLSTSHATAENTGLVYDEFHGPDRVKAFDGRLDVPLQPVPSQRAEPRPLNVVIPFKTPWYYNLSPHRGGPKDPGTLVIDYQVHDKVTGGDYVLDSTGFCSATSKTFGRGASCLGSTGKKLTMTVGPRVYVASNLVYSVQGAIPGNKVTLLLRAGPLSGFPGVALDRAQQCFVNLVPMLQQTVASDSITGNASFRYPIPRIGGLQGLEIHAQAFGYDINANSAEYVASLGLTTAVCGSAGVCQLMQLNGQASKAPKAQSNVYGMAHVVEFR